MISNNYGSKKVRHGTRVMFMVDEHLETYETSAGWEPVASPALWSALNFGEFFKPHITILGGDFLHFDQISRFNRNNALAREGRRLQNDFEFGNVVLDRIDGFTLKKLAFMIGNHDARLNAYVAVNSELCGLISLDRDLHLTERGYEIIPENKKYRVGHARFIHGWYITKYHASKTVDAVGDNIFYGHTHDRQLYTKINADDNPIMGGSVGCLCELNAGYMKNRPNKWVNGFAFYYFNGDGTFTPYFPTIIDGEFWYDGHKFTPEGRQ